MKNKIQGSAVKIGMVIYYHNNPCYVYKSNNIKPGKGGAYNQIEGRNILTQKKVTFRLRSSEEVIQAFIHKYRCTFSYYDPSSKDYIFMNMESYEEISISSDNIGDKSQYLKEGIESTILYADDSYVDIIVPENMTYTVVQTDTAIKGQSLSDVYKPAKLSNGSTINVPPFISIGDEIIVNTSTHTYVKRR